MSTILDALKKVERERQSPRDQLLHAPPIEPKRSRRLSPGVIAVCAAMGFAAGIGLALFRDKPPIDVAVLPNLPPPPAIQVPAPPDLPAAVEPQAIAPDTGTAPAAEVEQPEQVAAAPPPAAPPVQGPAAASEAAPVNVPAPPAGAAPSEAAASAPSVAEPPAAPPAPVVAAAPLAPSGPPSGTLEGESALEPSPFAAPRAGNSAAAAAADRPGTGKAALPPPVVAQPSPPDTLAALAPQEPVAAPAVDLPSEEPEEPPPPPATVIDTGRSPPGAPRVSLSFLQWSADPARRFAFVSIDGAPTQRVREGDAAGSLTVAEITPTGVQFKQDGKLFTIRPRH